MNEIRARHVRPERLTSDQHAREVKLRDPRLLLCVSRSMLNACKQACAWATTLTVLSDTLTLILSLQIFSGPVYAEPRSPQQAELASLKRLLDPDAKLQSEYLGPQLVSGNAANEAAAERSYFTSLPPSEAQGKASAVTGVLSEPTGGDNSWLETELGRYTGLIGDAFQHVSGKRGILLSATAMPAVGRLIRRPLNGGDASYCSGTLIAPNLFLTAAHCLCERGSAQHWPTRDSCIKSGAPGARISQVYFPEAGVFETEGEVLLGTDYNATDLRTRPKGSILDDLALVVLKGAVPIEPLSLPEDVEYSTISPSFSAGYGVLDLTNQAEDMIHVSGGPYREGISALAFPQFGKCKYGEIDAICSNYNSFLTGLDLPAAALCGGDSGGPLVGRNSEGKYLLLGVASMRMSQKGEQVCDSEDAVHSIYSTLNGHIGWLRELMKQHRLYDDALSSDHDFNSLPRWRKSCRESFMALAPDDGGYLSFRSASNVSASLTVASLYRGDQLADVSVNPDLCIKVASERSTLYCNIPSSEALSIRARGAGVLQIVICS